MVATIIVGIILLISVCMAVRSIIKTGKSGESISCGHGCSGCSGCRSHKE